MKSMLAIASTITLVALAGCSSQIDRKTASGSYKYTETKEGKGLVVPADLSAPSFSRDFELPELGENADPSLVGKNLIIQSPALVLPLVTGSHVEEGRSSATIWFDQVDDSQPLDEAIWNSLLSFLDEEGIGVENFDAENNVLVTDWMRMTKELDSPWYQWSDVESEISRRFEFSLEMKPHGRSAALSVDLKDYKEKTADKVIDEVSGLEERREEVSVLNQVIGHYEYQIQLEETRRIARIRQGLQTEMGFNSDGDAAYIVSSQYDVVWPRTLLVLRKLGFDVKDLDKSTGLLFVRYNGADNKWWDGLFSGDDTLLEKGDYRLKVAAAGENRTSITFMDDESVPFEPNQVSDLYSTFAEVMSEDNLDI
ncbi:outer membrane protein assembly factor BamC [Alteromonas sp. 345S023]|uniref:Outer membrane protein assembly factor BamC n=1 Tax=Alteromonas profundi TaxID=2696062 RepID=A0A7X5LQ27_9ALTE|nr:outer membrane protein assembly factor BamC [Alteromonas profundi]NDV92914.1 outer membrane protein assembly factor BamC [Alteromonas profundi]